MTDYETLVISQPEPGVFIFRMNRPASANALNTQMGLDLVAAFEAVLMQPQDYRCILLTGEGDKAFCAGGDLKERNGMTDAAWRAQHLIFERMARAILACPVPVIAAVNGSAYGGGCEIAAACDFIIAADTAMFALPETRLGIIPGAGGTQTIARAVGERRAKELLMSATPFSARDAAEWGLVNRVCPPGELIDTGLAIARKIAANAPLAVRQAKHAIHHGLQMSLGDALAFEIESYNRLVPTWDRSEGVKAFNERRQPKFEGR
jgi:enoyl-CoA hydratase/carnithine racemase